MEVFSMDIDEFMPQTGRMIAENNEVRNILDPITHNPRNTNSDHSAIHYGMGMCLHLYEASLAAEGKQVYRFKGPDTLYAHIKGIEVSGQGASCAVRLIRNATITDAGVEVEGAIQNLNDNSDVEPESKVYDSNVTYTGGTVWCEKIIHGDTDGTGVKKVQSGASFVQNVNLEYVTKSEGTDYILEIENLDDTNELAHLSVNMFFYEEPEGYVPYTF
jgi:hypothetical protein